LCAPQSPASHQDRPLVRKITATRKVGERIAMH
jgi:hypothetical protein